MNELPASMAELMKIITPEIHQNLKTAVELGRWANGDKLTPQQVQLCLQAVIAYDEIHMSEEQRVGYIDRSKLDK